jgi:Protein of unknown function (DUF1569)
METTAKCLEQISANIAELGEKLTVNPTGFNEAAQRVGEWSGAEILDHLSQVHLGVMRGLKASNPMPKRGLRGKIVLRAVTKVLQRGVKVPAKGAYPTTDPNADVAEMLVTLTRLQEKLAKTCLAPGFNGEELGFTHPVAGPLNKIETLAFIRDHIRYHIVQVNRVLAKMGA